MDSGHSGVRERLYQRYVTTHLGGSAAGTRFGGERRNRVCDQLYKGYLPLDKAAPILDLGCGSGRFISYLMAKGYRSLCGVDVSAEQVACAQAAGLPVYQGNAMEHLSGSVDEFELITALDFIEHLTIDEAVQLVEQVFVALRPGGAFVFQSPCAEGPFGSRYLYSDLTHRRAFTARSARQLLRLCGFEDIEIRPVRPVVSGLASFARHVIWRFGEVGLRLLLAAETGQVGDMVLTQNLIASGRKEFADDPGGRRLSDLGK